jgi:hypothetical protein
MLPWGKTMGIKHRSCRWLGGLAAAAALTVSSIARADVPDATWSALRGSEVILETQSGKRVGGKLIDVQPTTIALALPSGDSLMIDRGIVRSVRAAGNEVLPAYRSTRPQGRPGEVAPGVLEWEPGQAIPPGYEKRTQVRKGFVIAGSILFGTAWLSSVITAAGVDEPALAVPVVGPWILAAQIGTDSVNLLFKTLFIADGIQQAAGLALLIVGLTAPKTIVVRSDATAARTWWTPTPMSFGKGSVGLGIVGAM